MHLLNFVTVTCLKSYGDLILMELYMHCKNLYEQSNAGKIMCYGSLSHILSFFVIEDVCIGLKSLASRTARYLRCIKDEMFK